MKTITIITPSNIEIEYKLAGAGSRTAALIIDSLIQILAVSLFFGVLFGINYQLTELGTPIRSSIIMAIMIVVAFVIYFGYFIVCEMTMNGQTLGKRLFGLRAIRDNGQPIEFTQSLIRGIMRSSLDILYVGMFAIIFSKKHKRIGDMAAGTLVVIEKYDNKYEPTLAMQSTVPDFLPPHATPEERAVIENWLRRRHKLPNNGKDIGKKIGDYLSEKYAPH